MANLCLDDLPPEVLQFILTFLGPKDRRIFSQTCRRFYENHLSEKTKNGTLVTIRDDTTTPFKIFSASPRHVRHLVFQCTEINKERIPCWGEFWDNVRRHLRSLTFTDCNVSERTFSDILFYCKSLKSLTLDNCNSLFMVGKFLESQDDLRKAQSALSELKELHLSNNRYLSDALFNRIVTVTPSVELISLSGCQISFHPAIYKRFYPNKSQVASESVLTFQNILNFITHQGSKLKTLDFSNTLIDNAALLCLAKVPDLKLRKMYLKKCQQVSDEGISNIIDHHPFLSVLDASGCTKLTNGIVRKICELLPDLKVLKLQGCSKITDSGLENFKNLSNLEELNFAECEQLSSGCIKQALTSGKFKSLVRLNLAACKLEEDAVVALANHLPNLTFLDLSHCRFGVTDMAMRAISSNLPKLQYLSVSWCSKLSDSGLVYNGSSSGSSEVVLGVGLLSVKDAFGCLSSKVNPSFIMDDEPALYCGSPLPPSPLPVSIVSISNLSGLKELNLCGCEDVSDASFINGIRFRELIYLDVSLCHKITDEGLASIGRYNGSLETVILNQCKGISDAGVSAMVSCLPRLKHLDLQGCRNIGDGSLEALGKCCPELHYLDVSICLHITQDGLEKLENRLQCLKTVHRKNLQSGSFTGVPPLLWQDSYPNKQKVTARRLLCILCVICSPQQK